MKRQTQKRATVFVLLMCLLPTAHAAAALPVIKQPQKSGMIAPDNTPLPAANLTFVDPVKGNDNNPGSEKLPLKSAALAASKLKAGQTLVLRGGVYYETILLAATGTVDKPITIRNYPGEVVWVHAGFEEFLSSPQTAWQPVPGAQVEDEYQSTQVFETMPGLCANFADTMVPLLTYWNYADLTHGNMYWNLTKNSGTEGIYCGPGVHYNKETKRIHIRLAHTNIKMIGSDNYTGPTDPRKIPLIIGSKFAEPALRVQSAAHVKVQGISFMGSGGSVVGIDSSYDVELNNCTLYAGSNALSLSFVKRFRALHTAFRGASAPWNFRGHHKYRSREAKLVNTGGWTTGGCEDLEFGYCEFTDSIDGVFIGSASRVLFHNNYQSNFTDDGIFVSAHTTPAGDTPGGELHLFENYISRTLTMLAFGVGHGRQRTLDDEKKIKQLGLGINFYRNVVDLRQPVYYNLPRSAETDTVPNDFGRLMGDHGSPTWEPIRFYQNTVLFGQPADRGLYTWAQAMGGGTSRMVFNNAFVYLQGTPGGGVGKPPYGNLQADGNLYWPLDPVQQTVSPFDRFKKSADYNASKAVYPPGWMANDLYEDPKFKSLTQTAKGSVDLTPEPKSPLLAAGVVLPAGLVDPFKPQGDQKPDIGAVQSGKPLWRLGVGGRFDAFGNLSELPAIPSDKGRLQAAAPSVDWGSITARKPVAIIAGYPDVDRTALVYFLKANFAPIAHNTREWPAADSLSQYGLIVIPDDPRGLRAPAELGPAIKQFVEGGGTLLMLGRSHDSLALTGVFPELVGKPTNAKGLSMKVLKPDHPWIEDLVKLPQEEWTPKHPPLFVTAMGNGEGIENLIGDPAGASIFLERKVGKGKVIYVGWSLSAQKPIGTTRNEWSSTAAAEQNYQAQVDVIKKIVDSLYPAVVKFPADEPTR